MGFASMDDFIQEVTQNGKFARADFNKLSHPVTAAVAGEWSCLFHLGGNPTNGVLNAGTNLSFQSLSNQDAGAMLHGGDVEAGGDTKHILNAVSGSASATSMPASLLLVDMLGYYPRNNLTVTGNVATRQAIAFTVDASTDIVTHTGYDIASFSRVRVSSSDTLPAGLSAGVDYWTRRLSATTSRFYSTRAAAIADTAGAGAGDVDFADTGSGTHTVTVGLPRYTDGAGVQAFAAVTTVLGAATPNLQINYTNADGVTGKTTPTTLPVGKTAAALGLIPYSGTGAGKYGPFFPPAAGDRGVRSIEQTNLSASYVSGAMAFCLCRPLLSLPMASIGVMTERDLMNQMPSLPRVQDGACLAWLLYNGAATPANSGFVGHLEFGWG